MLVEVIEAAEWPRKYLRGGWADHDPGGRISTDVSSISLSHRGCYWTHTSLIYCSPETHEAMHTLGERRPVVP